MYVDSTSAQTCATACLSICQSVCLSVCLSVNIVQNLCIVRQLLLNWYEIYYSTFFLLCNQVFAGFLRVNPSNVLWVWQVPTVTEPHVAAAVIACDRPESAWHFPPGFSQCWFFAGFPRLCDRL